MGGAQQRLTHFSSSVGQAVALARKEVAAASATAIGRTHDLRKAGGTDQKVGVVTFRTSDSFVTHVAKASTRPSIAITVLSRRAVKISIRKGSHHLWTGLSRRAAFVEQILLAGFERTFVDSLALEIGGVAINTHKASVVRL